MKITVIGCGRWGSFIAYYLDSIGHEVTLYGRSESEHMKRFVEERKNDLLTLKDSVKLSCDIGQSLKNDITVISVNSQGLSALLKEINQYNPENKTLVLCMKGIETGTGRRLSEIVNDNLPSSNKTAVWVGPGHVQEFVSGIPNCMVIDSNDSATKKLLVDEFSSPLIRFYYGTDLIGSEIGAALKNVIGIAAGMLDGYGLSSLKGALMSRGTREVARLIKDMGGNELSAYGLAHLGDYEATVFSPYSHNRRFGEAFVRGESYTELAEGFYTVDAVRTLCGKYGTDMPICRAVYTILYGKTDPKQTLMELFTRSLKKEF